MPAPSQRGIHEGAAMFHLEGVEALAEHDGDVILIGGEASHSSKMPMLQLWRVD